MSERTIPSYSSPLGLGHKGADRLFDGPVVVEEKIDGSQFSFRLTHDGALHCRSRGAAIDSAAPEGMFVRGVDAITQRAPLLTPGYTYRGEYLQKPKHNTLAYARVPVGYIVLFDIDRGDQDYMAPDDRATEAQRIGLECVPVLFHGPLDSVQQLQALLPSHSMLGPIQPEGIVAKNYAHYTPDHKVLMGKYVTEAFKETHKKEWKRSNPQAGDVVARLIHELKTEARWQKSVQHLKEAGTRQGDARDIGALMKEAASDLRNDEADYIKTKLFNWAWPQIQRGVLAGLPEWYKTQLLAEAFPPERAA